MFAFRLLPLGVMLALAVTGWLWGAGWSARCAAWPWVVSLVWVGLPHGAADLAVARRRMTARQVAVAASGYVAVLAGSLLAFVAAPALVLPAFVLLSAWHFGLPLGGLAIGVPLVAWPHATARVAAEVAAVTGTQSQFGPADVCGLGLTVVAVALVVLIHDVLQAARHSGWRAACADVLDAAVVALLALATDPLFSVGVFFLCWHAWREMPHVACELANRCPDHGAPASGAAQVSSRWTSKTRSKCSSSLHRPPCLPVCENGLVPRVLHVHLAALPLLVPTWLALGMAWWLLPEPRLEHSLRGLAILAVAAYVVVTPPHVAAVSLGGRMMAPGPADAPHCRTPLAGSETACTTITRSMPTRPRPPVGAPSVGSTTGCSPGPTRPMD